MKCIFLVVGLTTPLLLAGCGESPACSTHVQIKNLPPATNIVATATAGGVTTTSKSRSNQRGNTHLTLPPAAAIGITRFTVIAGSHVFDFGPQMQKVARRVIAEVPSAQRSTICVHNIRLTFPSYGR